MTLGDRLIEISDELGQVLREHLSEIAASRGSR
jgi:hypothetical protein